MSSATPDAPDPAKAPRPEWSDVAAAAERAATARALRALADELDALIVSNPALTTAATLTTTRLRALREAEES